MSKQLTNLRHNFTEYYVDRLLAADPTELQLESAYIQGYLDALDCLIAVSMQQQAQVDGLNVIPQAYLEDLLIQLETELSKTKFLVNAKRSAP